MTRLKLEQLCVQRNGRVRLRDLSLQLMAGELLGLIGPNGAGKSTLLKALVQLLPSSGRIELLGQDARALSAPERARRLAYLSQDDRVQWPITVEHLVALGRHPHVSTQTQDRQAVEQALQITDLWPLRQRRVTELSGGERARARLARALAVQAPLLLADEPVAALDPSHQLKVMQYLRAYCREATTDSMGHAVLVVMHDLTLASRFCDRLLLLDQGAPVALGSPQQVLTPDHLRDTYGIHAITGQRDGQGYVLPWATTEDYA